MGNAARECAQKFEAVLVMVVKLAGDTGFALLAWAHFGILLDLSSGVNLSDGGATIIHALSCLAPGRLNTLLIPYHA